MRVYFFFQDNPKNKNCSIPNMKQFSLGLACYSMSDDQFESHTKQLKNLFDAIIFFGKGYILLNQILFFHTLKCNKAEFF